MKKIIFFLLLSLFGSVHVFAVCSITGGACSFSSSYEPNETEQNLINTIQEDRSHSYSNQYIQNIFSPNWNSNPQSNENNNCQSGICAQQFNIEKR